jgi:hypothetical protein
LRNVRGKNTAPAGKGFSRWRTENHPDPAHNLEDGDDNLDTLYGMIDAIGDKFDAASKALEANSAK